ncbi:roadblock/LC7 domain-containing protein [Streptomyces hygroscopicus]|uniref:Regulator of Ras-like GTPase activity (Roadblock/LC7/MglB family) n=1 Tax=Streptomyces demainii TaxID=588122 RepID=A0ABT9L6Q1_9ACTN|nr:roadblock/LC7 domain-containing protein [Streptomyces demainii]MDP9616381.1 putative regulator of Ras-like GTPase activity (Roadblock/LC7/MglB family) [Streptomyces demainii]
MTSSPEIQDLLTSMTEKIAGATGLVALSDDGIALHWAAMERTQAEGLAAMASSLGKLAQTVAAQSGDVVRRQLIDMDNSYLLLTRAGKASYMALRTERNANLEVATGEVVLLAKRIGHVLDTQRRDDIARQQGRVAAARWGTPE